MKQNKKRIMYFYFYYYDYDYYHYYFYIKLVPFATIELNVPKFA